MQKELYRVNVETTSIFKTIKNHDTFSAAATVVNNSFSLAFANEANVSIVEDGKPSMGAAPRY